MRKFPPLTKQTRENTMGKKSSEMFYKLTKNPIRYLKNHPACVVSLVYTTYNIIGCFLDIFKIPSYLLNVINFIHLIEFITEVDITRK
jgi:hypothetical protein